MSFRSAPYDVIVIGAGHAGCEAARACARTGLRTAMVTMNLDLIAQMSCNPAVGGIAKGHLVREVDALGGIMGELTDQVGIQFRLLNTSRGPAVWSPRAQCDKRRYRVRMRELLEAEPNLRILQAEVAGLMIAEGPRRVTGVTLRDGRSIESRAVIVTTGTFLNGLAHVGEQTYSCGRNGEAPSNLLGDQLRTLGLHWTRLKTGTPPRLDGRTIDWDQFERQEGDVTPTPFSFLTERIEREQAACHIAYTTEETHRILRESIARSPLYSGQIEGIGPRYCPSIEDKVVKFPDKLRHQIFLEPEGLDTYEVYVNGMSTSMPIDVQEAMVASVPGLENAEMMRPGYAIVSDTRWSLYQRKAAQRERVVRLLEQTRVGQPGTPDMGTGAEDRPSLAIWLKRPEARIDALEPWVRSELGEPLVPGVLTTVETELKYAGYIAQQERQISRLRDSEGRRIPVEFSYINVPGLSTEIRQKLTRVRPETLGQAGRIPGVTPAAIAVLDVYLSVAR